MTQNRKKRTSILILGISLIAFSTVMAIPSFSWLIAPQSSATIGKNLAGKATGAYFNGGDGSKDHPYEIDNPRQLYYFSWLQDLGYFNKRSGKTDSGAEDTSTPIKQYYFILTSDIDASSYTLPPAGTSAKPFVGNFNGAGHVIRNASVSNDETKLTRIPKEAEGDFTNGVLNNAEIVGFFGIIGQYKETLDYTIKGEDGAYVNEVKDLYFDNLDVDTKASQSLSGLIAGYVNGNLSYCGVRSGYLTFGTETKALDGYEKLSNYSLIGDYNSENFSWKGQPKSTGGDDYGNSIDIYTVSKRLAYMMQHYDDSKSTNTGKNGAIYGSDSYHIVSAISLSDSSHKYNYYSSGKMSAGLLSGTYIPLSVSSSSSTFGGDGSESTDKTAEIVEEKNGGYIVGGQYQTTNSYGNATIQLRNNVQTNKYSYASMYNGIRNSMTTDSSAALTMSEANLSFLYYDTISNTTYRLLDKDNAKKAFEMSAPGATYDSVTNKTVTEGMFNNYENVKSNFVSSISEASSAATTAGTIKDSDGKVIDGMLEPGIQLRKQSTLTKRTVTSGVKIAYKNYDSYEFYEGGINFTLRKNGYVSVVIGTYNGATKPPFYKLYSLDREESGTTSTIKEAKEIKNISGSFKSNNLAYQFESGYDASKLAFSLDAINSKGVFFCYSAYFMEIPLKQGSYFMTSGTTGTNFPFLLYFDIGQDTTGSGDGGTTTETPDIDFVYYEDEAATTKKILKINEEGYVASGVYFSVGASPTSVYFWRDSVSSGVFYCVLPSSSSSAVLSVGTGSCTGKDQPYSSEETSGS